MSEMPEPDVDEERFRANMKMHRERLGWSQGELSRRLIESGWGIFHQTTVSRIESGERPVKLGEARAIAAMLGVSLEKMMLVAEYSRLEADLIHRLESLGESFTTATSGLSRLIASREQLEHFLREGTTVSMTERDERLREIASTAVAMLSGRTPEMALKRARNEPIPETIEEIYTDPFAAWERFIGQPDEQAKAN
ncbi:helix-turn-helix transcriptional regulator [Arthrobacter sp. M4]|uniref:helix-turn-helix transcriptional regulator n=1 Tax=Arthrobacter sp. M4 TaxID=218160 RepID=UPI001CDC3572|nr:helix-turn-helix transcriptional regulator [Arthrobacter sp. M4]MCA4132957.1 helix-turn-helix transcriptional regulator [Arthrobacter sp. M4]